MAELAVFDKDPNIYLFTSLTAGSSHIITATSRIETILKANKIPFIGLDTATHELGKKLFQRRAAGKKLPLLVKEGYVLGGIEEIEEWNEYDELHEALGVDTAFTSNPPKPTNLFEPAPSKTPPPLAGALPGGFSFGQSAGPAFGSLNAPSIGSAIGSSTSKGKENTPIASAEQNLAIRQMGAEAAKLAASKKSVPAKISTTNPLITEKINAKSPGEVLSPKSTPLPASPATATIEKSNNVKKTALPDILSPREIPLPETPGVKPLLQQQKPVHAPPSIHDDAGNAALSAGPIKTTQAKEESSGEEESSDGEESSEESVVAQDVEKTQNQDSKDVSKAGASVEEGEQEEGSKDQKSEDSAKAVVEEKKKVETTSASQLEQSSSEETGEDDDEEEDEADEDDDEDEASEKEVKNESEAKASAKKEEVEIAKATAAPPKTDEPTKVEVKPEAAKKEDTKPEEVEKTQAQDAKDASKASESVLD
ncbi:hypothetical protein B5807_05900 [Epicoccum nigrum]|uniref:Glutaredoxin domain-containing protein n=1 Tax=Epicoccum nigrum TaxID=105696 RepID=A0A1Y2M0F8_EPING|nr:hypothetical protein B5807_05900 [Epicoccum nigrum]